MSEKVISHYFIYGLFDPRPERLGELRYVGQSTTGMNTPAAMHAAKCGNWQKHLRRLGMKPEIFIIEEWDGMGDPVAWLNDMEPFYIAYFRMVGCDLKNIAPGGEGRRGPLSEETKQRMRDVMTSERRKTIGDQHRGKIESAETRQKKSRAHLGPRVPRVKRKCFSCNSVVELTEGHPRVKLPRVFCSRGCAGKASHSPRPL